MAADAPLDLDRGFDYLYGLQIDELSGDGARGSVQVRDELRQPGGRVHGGVAAAISHSLACGATAAAAGGGIVAEVLSNQTSYLEPLAGDTIRAQARPLHRGRTTWVWEVQIADDAGCLCALARVTVAIRPR
ncbi:MAG: PaaI family thioesterase [Solirubrobacteraceae bacterium]